MGDVADTVQVTAATSPQRAKYLGETEQASAKKANYGTLILMMKRQPFILSMILAIAVLVLAACTAPTPGAQIAPAPTIISTCTNLFGA